MTKTDLDEEHLNSAVRGKTVDRITYDEIDAYLTLYFTDRSHVVLSTLGGVEIAEVSSDDH